MRIGNYGLTLGEWLRLLPQWLRYWGVCWRARRNGVDLAYTPGTWAWTCRIGSGSPGTRFRRGDREWVHWDCGRWWTKAFGAVDQSIPTTRDRIATDWERA